MIREKIARRLIQAYAGRPVEPFHNELPPGDVQAAYDIQEINTRLWLGQGRRLAGRKIGLTSVAVQRQLGVGEPDYGMLFADMLLCDGDEVPAGSLLQPKVEAEVALVLNRDLPDPSTTIVELMAAVEYVLPAIEVVDSRVKDWKITIQDTVADNASSALVFLGMTPVRLETVDLRLAGMLMERRGEEVSSGVGWACLGHPLRAALWLVRRMAEVGRPLAAGDLIMSGALGPMVSCHPGDIFEARIAGLGSVRAVFADEN